MKVAIFDTVGSPLRIGVMPDPTPADDEVVLRVAACGICGSDLHITEDPKPFGIGSGFVLGHEFSGEVVGVGRAVTGLGRGDRVAVAPMRGCGHCPACLRNDPAWCPQMVLIGGGYAEYATVAARQCRKLPDDLPTADGALAEPLSVALHCIVRSGMKPGARVAVIGAGPIGLLVAFWARRMGAASVIVADLSEHQKARALALGATDFVISGANAAVEIADRAGGAPDYVFECVGKRGLMDICVGIVRPQGTVVGVGLCVGGDSWDPFAALMKEINIVMSVFFHLDEFGPSLDAMRGGAFAPQAIISDRIGLDAVPAVFEGLRQRTTQCKVLIDPTGLGQ